MAFIAIYKDPKKKKLQILEIAAAAVLIALIAFFAPSYISRQQNYKEAVSLCETGHQLLHDNDINTAEQYFIKAIELCPEIETPYLELASIYYFRAEYEKEIETYKNAIKNIDGNTELHFALAQALFLEKRFDEALAETEKAIKLDPNDKIILKLKERCLKYKEHPELMYDTRRQNKNNTEDIKQNIQALSELEDEHDHDNCHDHNHSH